jgi:LysM repeat protein
MRTALIFLLILLIAACTPAGPKTRAPAMTIEPTSAKFLTHVVDEGETCDFIAFTYSITEQALIEANGLEADCSDLYLGQSLRIPRVTPQVPAAAGERISVQRAQELVRGHIFSTQPEMNPSAVFPLAEITSDAVWEALGAQIFKVTGDVMLNEAFVIRNGQVTPVGESFGGSGVTSFVLAELDGAAPPELIYVYDFGSGIHRSTFGIYRVSPEGVRAYEASEFNYQGELALEVRDGAAVVSGKPEAGGLWRALGTVGWANDLPAFLPAQ